MRNRFTLLLVVLASLALVLAACENTSSDDEPAEAADESAAESTDDTADDSADEEAGDEESESGDASDDVTDEDGEELASDTAEVEEMLAEAGFALCPTDGSASDTEHEDAVTTLPDLDLVSMEADALDRTFEAEAYDNTYVGEVTDDMFISVSLDSRYTDQAEGVSVYVCDSDDVSVYMTGEIDDGNIAISEDSVDVDLTLADDEVTGTVTVDGGDPQSITATQASGDAGLYQAAEMDGDVEVLMRWIVLEDGRQRGDWICCPKPTGGSTQCWCCVYIK
jgi:hypothetical protein